MQVCALSVHWCVHCCKGKVKGLEKEEDPGPLMLTIDER